MTFSWIAGAYGCNPPFPETYSKDEPDNSSSSKHNFGSRLMSLVRLLEKTNKDDCEEQLDEMIELLNVLIARYSRRGMLQGNVARAEQILSIQKSITSSSREKRLKKGSSKNELQIHHGESTSNTLIEPIAQDESLVFTSLLRILNGPSEESKKHQLDDDEALLIALASELCLAVSQRLKFANDLDVCTLAEYELLAQSGKSILAALLASLQSIESDIKAHTVTLTKYNATHLEKCLTLAHLDQRKHVLPINSCLKAATSLVNIFGTKLSRSTALLCDLKKIAWQFLTVPNDSIQHSAAKLIASIPFAGGTDRKSPSDLWNMAMDDMIYMLSVVLYEIAPLNKTNTTNDKSVSDDAKTTLQRWISFIREDIFEESLRVVSFQRFTLGLVECFQSLLSQDCFERNSTLRLVDAKLNIAGVLDLAEKLLSFPLSAETVYYKTKKRLRNEAIEGGLLSPRALSTQTANQMKLLGHDILNSLIESVGGPSLLPFARRISRISYATLLTSCSGPVRKVMDPTSAVQLDGKRRRWLHLSIPLRQVAIDTFKTVVTSFGSDRSEKSSNRSIISKSDGELSAALVAGCLIEEISNKEAPEGSDTCWGTFHERTELVTACVDCLKAIIVSCGGNLSTGVRSLIDSSAATALLKMSTSRDDGILSWSSVKVSLLELGSCCVATPWSDGASSSITNILVHVARVYEADMDDKVAIAAKSSLRFCDAKRVPRAPALLYVSRATSVNQDATQGTEASASDLIENLKTARIEASQPRTVTEKLEKAKKEKAEEKRPRDNQKNDITVKAAKRTKTEHTNILVEDSVDQKKGLAYESDGNDGKLKERQSNDSSCNMGDEILKRSPEDSLNQDAVGKDLGRDFYHDTFAEHNRSSEVEVNTNAPTEINGLDSSDDDDDEFPDIVACGPDSDDE